MNQERSNEFCRASDVYRDQVLTETAAVNPIYEEYLAEFKDKLVDVRDTTVLKELYVSKRIVMQPYLGRTDIVVAGEQRELPLPPESVAQALRRLGANSPERKMATLVTASEHRTCVILKGDIGVGKSTTTQYVLYELLQHQLSFPLTIIYVDLLQVFGEDHLFQVSAKELTRAVSERIDGMVWRIFADLGKTFYEYLLDRNNIPQQVDDCFGRYLEIMKQCRDDPSQFDRAVRSHQEFMLEHKDRLTYNMVRLLYLKENAGRDPSLTNFQRIVLVLDNLDNGGEDTHTGGIEIGKKFANICSGTCIIPLRYKTLEELKDKQGKEVDEMLMYVINVAPPDVGEVIERRLQFFLKDVPKRSKLTIRNRKIDPDEAISDVVVKLLNLLLTRKGMELLQSIHNSNVRTTIETCADIVASHEEVLPLTRLVQQLADVLPADIPPIRDRLAFDNLLLLVGLSNRRFYDSKYSFLENVFCCSRKGYGESNNMVKLRILDYLSSMQATGEEEIDLIRLCDDMREVFEYQETLVYDAVNQLLKPPRKLLWSRQGTSLKDQKVNKIQIYQAGRYYLENLCTYVWYVCLMKEDTWLPCDVATQVGFDRFGDKKRERFYREMMGTLSFAGYIVDAEVNEVSKITGKAGSALETYKSVYGGRTISGPMLKSFGIYMDKKRDHIMVSMDNSQKKYDDLIEKINGLSRKVESDIVIRLK